MNFENNRAMTDDAAYLAGAAQLTFVNRVYLWMCGALAITGVVAFFVAQKIEAAMRATPPSFNPNWMFAAIIAEVILVIALVAAIDKISAMAAISMFVLYSVLNGVTLSLVFMAYTASSVASTFFVCSATFGAMSIYGWATKRDLTAAGNILNMALWGIIIATIVNLFWANSTLYWIITYAGVLVFVGLTAYDTQKIRNLARGLNASGLEQGSEQVQKMAVLGALTLYLDFINLFLYLLRIMGQRRN